MATSSIDLNTKSPKMALESNFSVGIAVDIVCIYVWFREGEEGVVNVTD